MSTLSRLTSVAAMAIAMSWSSLFAQQVPEQFTTWGKQATSLKFLADPGLDTPADVKAQASDEEKDRGFILFAKPISTFIPADYAPVKGDICKDLSASDCAGQYGAVSFCVYGLQKQDYKVSVGDLTAKNPSKIAAANLDVRAARYALVGQGKDQMVTPVLLESFDSKTVQPGRVQQFWITYFIPKDAAAGQYSGAVTISAGDKKVSLPVTLKVYPFQLVKSPINFYIYFNTGRLTNKDLLLKDLIDQRCHGMTMSMIDMPMDYNKNDLIRDQVPPLLDVYKKAGFDNYIHTGLWNRIIASWLNTPDKSINMWGPWHKYYDFTPELDAKYVSAVKFINDEVTKRGLKLMLAVADEAGSHAWTIPATQHYNKLIKDKLPSITRELTVGGGWASDEAEDQHWKGLLDYWTTNRWLADKLEIVKKQEPNVKIQLYNMCGQGMGPGGTQSARTVYGFFAWKAQAAGVTQWVYGDDDAHSYVASGQAGQGPVPTMRWEAVREGVKDYLYIATLEKALAGKSGPAAKEAKDFLDQIKGKIELRSDTYDVIDGGRVKAQTAGTYEQWRSQIADFIVKLQGK